MRRKDASYPPHAPSRPARLKEREKGVFVAFDYTEDALHEIDRFFKDDHAVIIPLTVQEILGGQIGRKLA